MKWFMADTEFGDWIVDLDKVCFMTSGYNYDEGWADEARCHNYPVKLHMDNGKEYEMELNQRGYEALLTQLEIPMKVKH